MEKKKVFKWAVPILLLIIVLWVASSMFYTVQENEYALVVRFARVEYPVDTPGLHFKMPVIDDIIYFPKTKLLYPINQADVLTSDAKAMTVDSFIVWEISDPFILYQKLGTRIAAEARIEAITYNALQNTISTFKQDDIVGSADEQEEYEDISHLLDDQGNQTDIIVDEKNREYLNTKVTELVKSNAAEFGINVLDVKIKSFELPHDNEQSVFRRMISERERFARFERAEGEKEAALIINIADRDVNTTVSNAKAEAEKIIAEGEAEYMKILAEAYKGTEREEFYKFMRGLDALKVSLDGENKTVILDKESLLAQILISP